MGTLLALNHILRGSHEEPSAGVPSHEEPRAVTGQGYFIGTSFQIQLSIGTNSKWNLLATEWCTCLSGRLHLGGQTEITTEGAWT